MLRQLVHFVKTKAVVFHRFQLSSTVFDLTEKKEDVELDGFEFKTHEKPVAKAQLQLKQEDGLKGSDDRSCQSAHRIF